MKLTPNHVNLVTIPLHSLQTANIYFQSGLISGLFVKYNSGVTPYRKSVGTQMNADNRRMNADKKRLSNGLQRQKKRRPCRDTKTQSRGRNDCVAGQETRHAGKP